MEHQMKMINHIRLLKISLYTFILIMYLLLLLVTHLFIDSRWLYNLLIFDSSILFAILVIFIEIRVGFRYDYLYHHEFIPYLLQEIDPTITYTRYPDKINLLNEHTLIFDRDSHIEARSVIQMGRSELYDATISINTYKSNRIVIFKGYVLNVPNQIVNKNRFLILSNKTPKQASFKKLNELDINHYNVYSQYDGKMDPLTYEKVKVLLEEEYKNNRKYNLILNHQFLIFRRYWISLYRKPIFKAIDETFVDKKIAEFNQLIKSVNLFLKCFEESY